MLRWDKVKTWTVGMLAAVALLVVPANTVLAASCTSNAKDQVLCGVNSASGGTTGTSIDKVVKVSLQILSMIAGIIAVIMVMVAGLKYITSAGDSSSVASAKNTLLYAVVGIIVVVFAQMIVKFVFNKVK